MNATESPNFGSVPAFESRPSAQSGRSSTRAMSRRVFVFSMVVLSIGFGDFAAAAVPPGAASQFIRVLGDEAVATLRAPGFAEEAREARIRALVSEGFDLSYIGRFALGRYWRQATAEQRSEYLQIFGEYLLKTYMERFGGYADVTMAVISERPAGTKDVVVSTQIVRPNGRSFAADWRVRTTDGRYRIIDVMVEGVSMVVTQRSEFAAVIQRRGIQGLIDDLRVRY